MSNCSIDLNFLESNSELVIRNMVQIEQEQVTTEYQWFKGNKGKSYGGFVKEIGSDEKGLKAYILPKATKLFLEEVKEPENDTMKLNTDNKERIPGNLTVVGNEKKLYFFETKEGEEDKLLTRFDLCDKDLNDAQSDLGDQPEDDSALIPPSLNTGGMNSEMQSINSVENTTQPLNNPYENKPPEEELLE